MSAIRWFVTQRQERIDKFRQEDFWQIELGAPLMLTLTLTLTLTLPLTLTLTLTLNLNLTLTSAHRARRLGRERHRALQLGAPPPL